jgi:hypothetical protein
VRDEHVQFNKPRRRRHLVADGHMRLRKRDPGNGDLIAKVEERYSLPHWVAVQDVELWAQQTVRG